MKTFAIIIFSLYSWTSISQEAIKCNSKEEIINQFTELINSRDYENLKHLTNQSLIPKVEIDTSTFVKEGENKDGIIEGSKMIWEYSKNEYFEYVITNYKLLISTIDSHTEKDNWKIKSVEIIKRKKSSNENNTVSLRVKLKVKRTIFYINFDFIRVDNCDYLISVPYILKTEH